MIDGSFFDVLFMYFWGAVGAVWQKATGWPILGQNAYKRLLPILETVPFVAWTPTYDALRGSLYVLRFTFYVLRFTLYWNLSRFK